MHTVIETESYLRAAKDAKMSAEEMANAVDVVAADPEKCFARIRQWSGVVSFVAAGVERDAPPRRCRNRWMYLIPTWNHRPDVHAFGREALLVLVLFAGYFVAASFLLQEVYRKSKIL